jgi:nucleotide-binding universal stress UspA family protein
MKNIVVPIDFSPYSISAAKTGIFLAQKTGAQLNLLHVANAPSDWNRMPVRAQQEYPEIENRMVEAEIKLDAFAAGPLFKNVKANTHVYAGLAYDQIVQFVKTYKMDLIILGAHGAGESGGLFIGSTAQRVMRLASCPVLSVKKDHPLTSVKNILFPSDFEEDTIGNLNLIKNFASYLGAAINLVFVNTPNNFVDSETVQNRIVKFIPVQKAIKFHSYVYNDFEKERGILKFSENKKMDLITMVTHNRKDKPKYMVGITETILFHSNIPVLSIVSSSGKYSS